MQIRKTEYIKYCFQINVILISCVKPGGKRDGTGVKKKVISLLKDLKMMSQMLDINQYRCMRSTVIDLVDIDLEQEQEITGLSHGLTKKPF